MSQRKPRKQQHIVDLEDSRAVWREQVLEEEPEITEPFGDTKRIENRTVQTKADSPSETSPAKTRSQKKKGTHRQQDRQRRAQEASQIQKQQKSRPVRQAGRKKPEKQAVKQAQAEKELETWPDIQTRRQKPQKEARRQQQQKQTKELRKQMEKVPAAGRQSEAARESRKAQRKVFSKGFKRAFFISWAAFAVILIVGLVILWSTLKRYENGLPEHYLNQVIQNIENGDLTELHLVTAEDTGIDDPSIIVDSEQIQNYLKNKSAETPLDYVKVNAESTAEENVYLIRTGEDKLLKIFLTRDMENGKPVSGWHETKTQMVSDDLAVSTLTAQIPTSATLMVGSKEVPESFVTESGAQVKLLENLISEGIIGPQPTVDTYTVRGIFPSDAAVSIRNEDGSTVACTLSGDVYTAGFEADEAFTAEQTERVISLFEPYAKYFSGDAGKAALDTVMLNGSPAYESASAADVSWMQAHDGISLSDESVTNIKKYSDDCYSCDIRFVQDILRGGESVRTWDTNMTWIMVNDGNYYLADLVTRTSSDTD